MMGYLSVVSSKMMGGHLSVVGSKMGHPSGLS